MRGFLAECECGIPGEVAGAEPPVDHRRRRRFGVLVVAGHQRRAPDPQLPDLTIGKVETIVRVDDAELQPRHRCAANILEYWRWTRRKDSSRVMFKCQVTALGSR